MRSRSQSRSRPRRRRKILSSWVLIWRAVSASHIRLRIPIRPIRICRIPSTSSSAGYRTTPLRQRYTERERTVSISIFRECRTRARYSRRWASRALWSSAGRTARSSLTVRMWQARRRLCTRTQLRARHHMPYRSHLTTRRRRPLRRSPRQMSAMSSISYMTAM